MTLPMNDFNFERPRKVEAVFQLLKSLESQKQTYRFCGGGTDLIPSFKVHGECPHTLISLNSIEELKGVQISSSHEIKIGSQTTLAELCKHPELAKQVPELGKTAAKVASPQIRNRATLGGNLLVNNRCSYFNQSEDNREFHHSCFKANGDVCHLIPTATRGKSPLCRARFVSDLASIFLLLDATLRVKSSRGERTIKLSDFYLKDGIESNQLKNDEVLLTVEFKTSAQEPVKLNYQKLRIRNAIDFPSLGVGIRLGPKNESLHVVLIGVQTFPVSLQFTPKEGQSWDECVAEAISVATKSIETLRQDFFSPQYRRKMVGVYIKKALRVLM